MNLLLVCEESAGLQLLRTLHRGKHQIVAVMASPEKRPNISLTVWDLAKKFGYPTWPPELVKRPAFAEQIRNEKVDLLLNVHSLFIFAKEILDAPRLGCYNLHPGPLPGYAGLNAPSWAIYNGECWYGATLHKMEPRIDSGPIVFQSHFRLEDNDTGLSLISKCVKTGIPLVLKLIDLADQDPNQIPLIPQDLSQRRYFGKDIPFGGYINWSCSARHVVDFIRACDYFPFPSPWGEPKAILNEQEINITKAKTTGDSCRAKPGTIGDYELNGIRVACSDEWITVQTVKIKNHYFEAKMVLRCGECFTILNHFQQE